MSGIASNFPIDDAGFVLPGSGDIIVARSYPTRFIIMSGSSHPDVIELTSGYNPIPVLPSGGLQSSSCAFFPCDRCGGPAGGDAVTVIGVSGLYVRYCWKCANYKYQRGGFQSDREIIEQFFRDHGPLVDAETPITADWFEEHGMQSIADYLRGA